MSAVNLSTKSLKRSYFRNLKRAWRLYRHRQTGFYRDLGLSREYWAAYTAVVEAHSELKRRGVFLP